LGTTYFFAFQTAGLGQWFLSDKKLSLVTKKFVLWMFFEEKGVVIRDIAGAFQRRHSALRTIRGGIWWGFGLLWLVLTQLVVLGYQRMLSIFVFVGNRFFFIL